MVSSAAETKVAGIWARLYGFVSGRIDTFLLALMGKQKELDGDFDANADWAIAEQTPRGARLLIWLGAIAVFVLIVWAALADLDEVTRGEGKVIPSRQVQILQSLDGGIVSDILVKEGQTVKTGDLLVKVDPTRMVSSLRENQSQYLSLLAKAARLRAIAEGSKFVPPEEVIKEAPEIAEQERNLYESRQAELEAGIAVTRQQ
ncbi:biotin/lipoyl-binding protein, partial [Rhodoferax sp. 4810]|nr:biotin/lipoyl-binding protein [Rhodoferax jenense]